MGAIVRAEGTSALSDAQAKVVCDRLQRRIQERYGGQLRKLTFPVYGAKGWPGCLAGVTSDQDGASAVTVAHGAWVTQAQPYLKVRSEFGGAYLGVDDGVLLRDALARHLRSMTCGSAVMSEAVLVLRSHASARHAEMTSFRAKIETRQIPTDGMPMTFSYAEAGTVWVAVGTTTTGVTITLAADGIQPDTLRLRIISMGEALRVGTYKHQPSL